MKAILTDPAIKKALVSISPTSRQSYFMREPTEMMPWINE
jgi:hypothetical protein